MPCDCSHMEQTSKEAELQRAALLLVFVMESLNKKPDEWMIEQAANRYAKDERAYTMLCDYVKAMSDGEKNIIIYNARDARSRDLADWWENHQAIDKLREEKERQEAEREAVKKQAISKLTVSEMLALGIKD